MVMTLFLQVIALWSACRFEAEAVPATAAPPGGEPAWYKPPAPAAAAAAAPSPESAAAAAAHAAADPADGMAGVSRPANAADAAAAGLRAAMAAAPAALAQPAASVTNEEEIALAAEVNCSLGAELF